MKTLTTLLFGLISQVVLSQNFVELANVGYGVGTGDGYDGFVRSTFALKAPIIFDEAKNNILLLSISGSKSDAELDPIVYGLSNLTFNPAYVRKMGERSTLTLMVFNRWNGVRMGFKSDTYQLGGLFIWAIRKNENFTYRFGMYGNDELFGPFVTPFFGLDWVISDRLRFYGNLPILFTLAYKVNDRVDLGLDYFGLISSFRQPETYVERRVLNLGPYTDIYITKQLVFRLHAGYLIGSSLNEFDLDEKVSWALNLIKFGDNRTERSQIDVSGFFFTGYLSFRIRTD